MKVSEVMTKAAALCHLDTTLSAAAELMWRRQCGFLPVTGEGGNVIGVVTDRDIGIAMGTRKQRPSELLVKDVMPARLFTCTADDGVRCALTTMRIEGLRRLPVIDREGALVGVLSIDDLVLKADESAAPRDVSYKDIEDVYKASREHVVHRAKKREMAA